MIKKTTGEKVFYVFNVFLMLLLCFAIIYPYIHVAAVSLNDSSRAVNSGLMLVPKIFTLANYQALLNDNSIIRAFFCDGGAHYIKLGARHFHQFHERLRIDAQRAAAQKIHHRIFLHTQLHQRRANTKLYFILMA